ncbi:DUF445 domain-containing protein [Zhongshania aliphaticivorans]|uniref:DUF445 domain-containing protein n=1 Tax=Zhongshania aliphaticivorans TaxID=1470434 RepID=UPI0012E4CE84|nr:DUF445 domain-containing protein [Zhongshania aliphaticivorans]CAA0105967.1 Uncharacterised protein [Zhongshania aliphaticivorans]
MLEAVWLEFTAHWVLYLSMPITSGVVGFITNVVAIKMMFSPLEFVGKRPIFGWQGIIPSKAGKMASIAVDTIVPRLITEREVFDRLDPVRVAQEIEGPIVALVNHMVEEIMSEFEPGIWETLPRAARDLIIHRIQADAPDAVAEVMKDLRNDIENVFDLKDMVITTLVRDKTLINRIFQETGSEEFKFIGVSGLYFGALFGFFQMVGWMFYKADWQLPLFGLLVGYCTNVVALKMIFQPQSPMRFGPWKLQGIFHKRQKEVSRDYARLIADEIVTPSNIIESVLKGPYSDRVFMMIARHVKRVIDDQSGMARPFVAWTVGTRQYVKIKEVAVVRLVERLPETVKSVDVYAKGAMDLANTLAAQLEVLPPPDFEDMLRPAFKEDEWILILVGAALGCCVGIGQLILFTYLG